MTINAIITEVDDLKPNHYSDVQKIKWLNVVEERIIEEILKKRLLNPDEVIEEGSENENILNRVMRGEKFEGYTETDDMETEPIAQGAYAELYKYYLFSMIDLHNEEYDRYQNSAQLFNESYQSYADYWSRNHKSRGPVRFRT